MADESLKFLPTIDIHTHFPLSPVTFFISDAKNLPSFDEYLAALNNAHVTEAVLLCGPKKESMRQENELLATRVEPMKRRFLLVAWLNPKYDSPDDFQDLIEEKNFRGLKLHPVFDGYKLTDPIVKPFVEKAIEFELPIMIHSGWGPEGSVKDIAALAETYSDGTFVCLHMKEEYGLNDRFSHIEMAAHHPNLFLECSYIPHPRRLAEAVDVMGVEKILFGSDYPWGARDITWEKTKVTYAPISYANKKRILTENAKDLFNL
ncbi:MAG: amidohydrolase family protein [Promethearchaeota archaeon]